MMLRLCLVVRCVVPVLLALLGSPLRLSAQDRTLHWPAFDVVAHLDSTGALTVRERQTIRFTGDWNGGERVFSVGFGQQFSFTRLLRVDSLTGAEVVLREGDLDAVDEYDWADSWTLRWRSRLPTDPPFDSTVITYVLEYEYRDILVPTDSGFLLDHEFGFRDRFEDITNFTLSLTLDPGWGRSPTFAGRWREDTLPPGYGFLVTVPLTWQGAGVPSNVWQGASADVRRAIGGMLVLGLLLLTAYLVVVERRNGKFAPLLPHDRIDEAWLKQHVLSMPAELVGAAWDERISSAEVSATLARLVSENKLKSKVVTDKVWIFKRHVLHLDLLVRRDQFAPHERSLIDALFEPGARSTSTDAVRTRYASTGFDPVMHIRRPLQEKIDALPGAGGKAPPNAGMLVTMALLVPSWILLALGIRERGVDSIATLIAIAISVPVYMMARALAAEWRARVIRPALHMLWFLVPVFGAAGGVLWLLQTGHRALGPFTLAGLALWVLALHQSVLGAARSQHSRERIAFRKQLASAREYFRRELRQSDPKLREAWYPHLLAFGLGRHVDRWFKAFGAASTSTTSMSRESSSSLGGSGFSSASGGSSWGGFGGGGGFAGAGATVAFGAALGGMSSSMSAPSSSSSGGGGSSSSSGGSSGGGGGGGW